MVLKVFTKLQAIINTRPTIVILGILVGAMLIFAVYLGGPWYNQVPTAAVVQSLDTQASRMLLALIYASPAVMYIWGLLTKCSVKLKRSALMIFMVYLFATILRVVAIGFFPMFWLYLLALALVAGVIWIAWELKESEAGVKQWK